MKKLLLLSIFLIGYSFSSKAITVEGLIVIDRQTQKAYSPFYNQQKGMYEPQEIIFKEGVAFTEKNEKIDIRDLEDEKGKNVTDGFKAVGVFQSPAYKNDTYVSQQGIPENWVVVAKDFNNIFQHYVCVFLKECEHFDGSFIKMDNVDNFFNDKPYKILSVNQIKNGKKNGLTRQYYANGNLAEKCMYKEDVEDGTIEQYWENGNLKWKGTYKSGKLNGEDQIFDEQGRLAIQATYVDNLLKGPFVVYTNGKLKAKGNYIGEGNMVKDLEIYSESGALIVKEDIANFAIK